jgi:ubiquinone/menaquinone biosynthesis C-methylase UbiE
MADVEPRAWSSQWRDWVTAKAHGLTLEIGAGDGVNFAFYEAGVRVIATEPDRESLDLISDLPASISLSQASAEDLPFPDATFDAVVGTLVFCTIPDAPRALEQVRRVLKPGGSLRLVEHIKARNPLGRALMEAANPAWRWMTGGCNINRDTLEAVRRAGFRVTRVNKRMGGLLVGLDAVRQNPS